MIKILVVNEVHQIFKVINNKDELVLLGKIDKKNHKIEYLFDSNWRLLVKDAKIHISYKTGYSDRFFIKEINTNHILSHGGLKLYYNNLGIENIELIELYLEDGYYYLDNKGSGLIWN